MERIWLSSNALTGTNAGGRMETSPNTSLQADWYSTKESKSGQKKYLLKYTLDKSTQLSWFTFDISADIHL